MSNIPVNLQAMIDNMLERYSHLEPAVEGLLQSFQVLSANFDKGGIFYLCGNGGSFADAIHIKGELTKCFEQRHGIDNETLRNRLAADSMGQRLLENLEFGLPVVVLGESHSLRSAYANDRDPLLCYAQELYAFVSHIPDGVLMALSTSGNAQNVLAAVTLARALGIATIGFTGPDGGQLARMADISWKVPGCSTAEIQENQLPLYHLICRMVEYYFAHRA